MSRAQPDLTDETLKPSTGRAVCRAATVSSGKVLIVEDEPEILEPLSHFLRRAGFTVLQAEDGLSACRMIGSQKPDLVLLDILLPDLDGWEVCRLLRQHPEPRVATTPVIMLTALNADEDKLRGLELGADVYLPKPYSLREVLLMAGNLIERRRRQDHLEEKLAILSRTVEQQEELHGLLFHELRNQLSVLSGFTQFLATDGSAPYGGNCLTAMQRSTSYLQQLAEDFLLIRRVQSGSFTLPLEELPVHEIAAEMVNLYEPVAGRRRVTLRFLCEGDVAAVQANRSALRIILSALIDNALKYGPTDSLVTVVCRFADDRVALEVYDAGDGIPPGEQEKIFEQFYRGTGVSRQLAPGSGLGLYGVRVLTRAMGGDAEVDAQLVGGTSLRAWLPVEGASPELPA